MKRTNETNPKWDEKGRGCAGKCDQEEGGNKGGMPLKYEQGKERKRNWLQIRRRLVIPQICAMQINLSFTRLSVISYLGDIPSSISLLFSHSFWSLCVDVLLLFLRPSIFTPRLTQKKEETDVDRAKEQKHNRQSVDLGLDDLDLGGLRKGHKEDDKVRNRAIREH